MTNVPDVKLLKTGPENSKVGQCQSWMFVELDSKIACFRICWNCEIVITTDYLESRKTVIGDYYSTLLTKLRSALVKKTARETAKRGPPTS